MSSGWCASSEHTRPTVSRARWEAHRSTQPSRRIGRYEIIGVHTDHRVCCEQQWGDVAGAGLAPTTTKTKQGSEGQVRCDASWREREITGPRETAKQDRVQWLHHPDR